MPEIIGRDPRRVDCPRCQQPKGSRCRSKTGKDTDYHAVRYHSLYERHPETRPEFMRTRGI